MQFYFVLFDTVTSLKASLKSYQQHYWIDTNFLKITAFSSVGQHNNGKLTLGEEVVELGNI
jgi:hypothetical protein